jgi:hypothetical protein
MQDLYFLKNNRMSFELDETYFHGKQLNENSFHGSLIKVVTEKWAESVAFKMADQKTFNKLQLMFDSYIPTIETNTIWDTTPEDIDRGLAHGRVVFIDENDNKRVASISILNSGTIISENEEN